MGKFVDLTGKRFGNLVVESKAPIHITKGGQQVTMWNCRCDCGNTRVVPSGKLNNGEVVTCAFCKKFRHEDLTGRRFGYLTIVGEVERRGIQIMWKCKCDCGNYIVSPRNNLMNGHTKSCGCKTKEMIGNATRVHGHSKTRVWAIYSGMKARCYNENFPKYKDYGARGICICDEWLNDFMAFYNWSITHGYSDDLSIDRINVNGNYEPTNCRWATLEEQSYNKRNTLRLEFNGEEHSIKEWSEITGLSTDAIRSRLQRNWSIEKTLSTPQLRKSKK